MKKVFATMLLLGLISSISAADSYHFFDTERLLQASQEWQKYQRSPKDADAFLVAEYAGYVGAVFDQEETGVVSICVEEGTTKNDILKAVSNYISREDRKFNKIAPEVVEDALYWEYACR